LIAEYPMSNIERENAPLKAEPQINIQNWSFNIGH